MSDNWVFVHLWQTVRAVSLKIIWSGNVFYPRGYLGPEKLNSLARVTTCENLRSLVTQSHVSGHHT